MNKQLKQITRTILVMFLTLFLALTMIQVVNADSLRANVLNQRSNLNAFQIERGSILVDGNPIVFSAPSNDDYKFMREYANGPVYAPVTGYFSHYQGLTGIEHALNEQLSGTANNQFLTRLERIMNNQDPQGSSVELTINSKAQLAAYSGLADMRGAVVALEPETGKILALVSTPSFDPNLLAANDNQEIIRNYRELDNDPAKPLHNRAVAGDMYHPGSVFKLVTTAAALESGDYKTSSTVADPATWQLPGSSAVMRNASETSCDGGDRVSLETALIRSCNIPFAQIATSMKPNAIADMAKAFGFEKKQEIPFPTSASTVGKPRDDAQLAMTSIGQYEVRVTPLQIASVTAAIVNGGKQMRPNLVENILTPDLRPEYSYVPEVAGTPISSETAAAIRELLIKGVTDSTGLARRAQITDAVVGGKTGTAEVGRNSSGDNLPYNLWFTGFAQKGDQKVVVAVVVEDAGGARYNYAGDSSIVPTIIGKQVMEAVLNQ